MFYMYHVTRRNKVCLFVCLLSIYRFVRPGQSVPARPSGFINEQILDTLYVQRFFIGYHFIVRYTLLGIGFDDKDY